MAELCPDELEVLLVVVEVERGGLDVRMQVLWSFWLAGLLGWPFLLVLAVFMRLPVPLDCGLDVVSDRFEDVEAVVDDGCEGRFLQVDELAKRVDRILDGIFKRLLFVLDRSLLLRRECVGLAEQLLAIGDDGPGRGEYVLVVVAVAGEFLEGLFIHC